MTNLEKFRASIWQSYVSRRKRKRDRNTYIRKNTLKTKIVKRDKEWDYTMIKESIKQEYVTILNIYAPDTGAPKYIRQILTDIKREIDSNTIILGA